MKTLKLAIVSLILAQQALAIPMTERPFARSEMELVSSRGYFNSAQDIVLTVRQDDGSAHATSLELEYRLVMPQLPYEDAPIRKEVRIVDVNTDECGSTIYHAQMPVVNEDKINGPRFHVTLVDHSTRICEDYRPFLWEAHVREGFGWCGTMDSTMSLRGNPAPVYTIQTF